MSDDNEINKPSDKKDSKIKKPSFKKTLEQKVASAQLRLNRLQHKSKKEAKQLETRQKIILGAEVAKVLDCNVFSVDKELVLGILLNIGSLHKDDKEKYRNSGRLYLASMKGRKF